MGINDEPLEAFYPHCAICGDTIYGEGYQIEGKYYCDNCIEERKIDGYDVAESLRDAAFENARESYYS